MISYFILMDEEEEETILESQVGEGRKAWTDAIMYMTTQKEAVKNAILLQHLPVVTVVKNILCAIMMCLLSDLSVMSSSRSRTYNDLRVSC